MTKIRELKEAYKGEWLAVAVSEEKEGTCEEGVLLYHSEDRDDVWRMIKDEPRRIYVTYAGAILEEGQGVAY
jgi:hypothetical protein